MMNQPETKNSAKQLYTEWFPQIIYNQHQTGPYPSRIFVPPFDDPMNPNIPPLVMRGVNLVGDAMTRRLDQEGKRGAVSRVGFDTWWNGGMRTAPYYHNMVGILTETSHASATPAHNDPSIVPEDVRRHDRADARADDVLPEPVPRRRMAPPQQLRLHGDDVDGRARHRREAAAGVALRHLSDGARRDPEQRAETFVVPSGQWDPGTAVKMINVLRLGGVEVERATAPFSAGRPAV